MDEETFVVQYVFKLCDIEREGPYSSAVTKTIWVPDALAKLGARLQLLRPTGDWRGGWKVVKMYANLDDTGLYGGEAKILHVKRDVPAKRNKHISKET